MIRTTSSLRSAIALVAGLSLTVASCGDDNDNESAVTVAAATGATGAPEEEGGHQIVDDATVTAGLATTGSILTSGAATPDTAETVWDEAHESWETYEGTIKQNMPESYLAMEDALAAYRSAAEAGDTAGLSKAAGDFQTSADAYLAAFPG